MERYPNECQDPYCTRVDPHAAHAPELRAWLNEEREKRERAEAALEAVVGKMARRSTEDLSPPERTALAVERIAVLKFREVRTLQLASIGYFLAILFAVAVTAWFYTRLLP